MTSDENLESGSQEEEQTLLYMRKGYPKGPGKGLGKGKGKGKKGKPSKGSYRDEQHRHVAPQLSFDGSKGKGKGKPPFKGKKNPSIMETEARGMLVTHIGVKQDLPLLSHRTRQSRMVSATKLATLLIIAEHVKLCIVAPCTNKLGANSVAGSYCYSTS